MKFSKDTLYLLLNEIMQSKKTKYLIITLSVVVVFVIGGYIISKNKSNSDNKSTKNEVTQNSNETKKEDKKETSQTNETKKEDTENKEEKNNDKNEEKTNAKLSEDIEITEERAIRLIKKVVVPNLGPKFQNAQLDFKSEGKNTVNKEKCFLITISQKGKNNKVESVGKYAVTINGRTIYQFNSKTNAYEKYNNKY